MDQLIEQYQRKYRALPTHSLFSPYRICPVGAHVDHQQGMVTGLALDHGIHMVFAPQADAKVRVYSEDFTEMRVLDISDLDDSHPSDWSRYLKGACLSLRRHHRLTRGIKAVLQGSMPSSGLSSSAAVITAYLKALAEANGIVLNAKELIQYNSWVEREYLGLNNGILDQACNVLSKKDHLLALDCKSGEHVHVEKSKSMPEFSILVLYSGVKKTLTETGYNLRVDECRTAAWLTQELSRVIADASGEADVAYRAGVPFWQTEKDEASGLVDCLMYRVNGFPSGEKLPQSGPVAGRIMNVWGPKAEPMNGADARQLAQEEIATRLKLYDHFEEVKKQRPYLKDAQIVDTGPLIGVRQTRFLEGEYKLQNETTCSGVAKGMAAQKR